MGSAPVGLISLPVLLWLARHVCVIGTAIELRCSSWQIGKVLNSNGHAPVKWIRISSLRDCLGLRLGFINHIMHEVSKLPSLVLGLVVVWICLCRMCSMCLTSVLWVFRVVPSFRHTIKLDSRNSPRYRSHNNIYRSHNKNNNNNHVHQSFNSDNYEHFISLPSSGNFP